MSTNKRVKFILVPEHEFVAKNKSNEPVTDVLRDFNIKEKSKILSVIPTRKKRFREAMDAPIEQKIVKGQEIDVYDKALEEVTTKRDVPKTLLSRIKMHETLSVGDNLNIYFNGEDTGLSASEFVENLVNKSPWA